MALRLPKEMRTSRITSTDLYPPTGFNPADVVAKAHDDYLATGNQWPEQRMLQHLQVEIHRDCGRRLSLALIRETLSEQYKR